MAAALQLSARRGAVFLLPDGVDEAQAFVPMRCGGSLHGRLRQLIQNFCIAKMLNSSSEANASKKGWKQCESQKQEECE